MKNTATKINWKGMECIQLCAGGYTALIAPGIGSNVLRLHDDAHGVEFSAGTRTTPRRTSSSLPKSGDCPPCICRTVLQTVC